MGQAFLLGLKSTVDRNPYQVIGEAVIHTKAFLIDQRAHDKLRQIEPKWLLGLSVGPVESPDLRGKAACFLPRDNKHHINKRPANLRARSTMALSAMHGTGWLLREGAGSAALLPSGLAENPTAKCPGSLCWGATARGRP